MAVRFPLPATVFPPMKVHSDQAMQFAETSDRIVGSTLVARREYINRYHRQLDPNAWQLVKQRATTTSNLSVFKPRSGLTIPSASMNASPILIGTGTVEGSLDEVMLGLTATNTSAMRFVTSTLYQDVADARVLTRIDTPNDSDPFAFLGFKWVVKVPSKRLVPLARARDFLYLESTGIRDVDNGNGYTERVGFQLLHSVDLTCCPPLPIDLGVVRGHLSFCFLFVECGENRVEVFCKGFVDPRGCLSRRLTINVAADVIMDCANAITCAQRKKIEWTLKEGPEVARLSDPNDRVVCETRLTESGSSADQTVKNEDDCDACIHCSGRQRRTTFTVWNQPAMCGICSERVCSHCSRQVNLPGAASATEMTTCCMRCIDRAETIDAASFARELAQRAMAFQPRPYGFSNASGLASPGEKPRLAPIQKKPLRRHTLLYVE